jgi:hypothetical protein
MKSKDIDAVIKLKNSFPIFIENSVYYNDKWGSSPIELPRIDHAKNNVKESFPAKTGN